MIINKLKEIQKREHLTDIQVAKLLDIHPISWNRIKNHRAGYSVEFLRKAVHTWPELGKDVLLWLYGDKGDGDGS